MRTEVKIKIRNFVTNVGIEKAIAILPDYLNLETIMLKAYCPVDTCLRISKYKTTSHTMWFISYIKSGSRSETSYLQTNAISLVEALVQMIEILLDYNILDIDDLKI